MQGSGGTARLFSLAEQKAFAVTKYPSLGEVPPHPSLLVQGPDLLLLLLLQSFSGQPVSLFRTK